MNEAIDFATAIIDLERECPRGYNASAHITEYVHLCHCQQERWLCCIRVPSTPLELREFFVFPTSAQERFWKQRHIFVQP